MPGVTPPQAGSKLFGANALKADRKIFAMFVRGELVVKLPRTQVDALVAAGDGRRFASGGGRIMREWLIVARVDEERWLALASEAHGFVRES